MLFPVCWFWHVTYSALELSRCFFTDVSTCLQADVQRCIFGCAFRYKGVSSEGGGSTDSGLHDLVGPALVEVVTERVVMVVRDCGSCCDYVRNLSRQGASGEQRTMAWL